MKLQHGTFDQCCKSKHTDARARKALSSSSKAGLHFWLEVKKGCVVKSSLGYYRLDKARVGYKLTLVGL